MEAYHKADKNTAKKPVKKTEANYKNVPVSHSKMNELNKEGFPQSAYEDVEGDKIKRLVRLVGHRAINKVQQPMKQNCACADSGGCIWSHETDNHRNISTTQHQLACRTLPPVFELRSSSLFLSFLSPVCSYILRVQPVIVFPEATFR